DVAGFAGAHFRYHQHVALATLPRGVEAHDDGIGDLFLAPAVEAPLDGASVAAALEDGIESAQRLGRGPSLLGSFTHAQELAQVALRDVDRHAGEAVAEPRPAVAMALDVLARLEVDGGVEALDR